MRWLLLLCLLLQASASQPFYDRSHDSAVFHETRKYRIFLPPDYETSSKRYPVIYYFHGHSDRYTLEKYDNGLDTVPKVEAFVASHAAIVVAADGYVARDYTGFYGGTPYDVLREGGDFDYGEYFLELNRHIDTTYRTLSSRRYRAVSGLSMGGFISLYLSARYPDVIGSASAFNPGPEFYIGPKARRSLWRPKDHVLNHQQTMIRLIRASGDYISQYHEETRNAYAIEPTVDFEFRQDEYHRHWATSIGETFEFHMRAFANPSLDTTPVEWNYATAYDRANVWGYRLSADSNTPAIFYLEHVSQGGLRIRTRQWAPDGPAAECSAVNVITAPLYRPGEVYRVRDHSLAESKMITRDTRADAEGRLTLQVDCSGHEIGLEGAGTGAQPPVLLPVTTKDVLRLPPGRPLSVPVRVFNPRGVPLENVTAELESAYPTVAITRGKASIDRLAPGAVADLSSAFEVRLTAGEGVYEHARLELKLIYDGYQQITQTIDLSIAPEDIPAPVEVAILDGRKQTFPVFRQKGNQGGGSSIERTVSEGVGNGNGAFDPGEQATIWVKLKQGMDPFDKNNWCRAKVYSDSRWLVEIGDIQEQKQLEWTSGQSRTSVLKLSANVPAGTEIPVTLDCESWSYHFTPDVRYGKQPLYQAYQLHRHHLFAWTLKTP
jgi:pimeloyl-ACP methyl ester carboxylesterase